MNMNDTIVIILPNIFDANEPNKFHNMYTHTHLCGLSCTFFFVLCFLISIINIFNVLIKNRMLLYIGVLRKLGQQLFINFFKEQHIVLLYFLLFLFDVFVLIA